MKRPLLWVCLCLVMLAALRHYASAPPDLPVRGAEISVIGRIYQKNQDSFYLKIQSAAAVSGQEKFQTNLISKGSRVICEYENAESVRLGSVVVLRGRAENFSRATNPGEFDYQKYYGSLGFAARLREARIMEQGEKYSRLLEGLYTLKIFWKNRLYAIFPEKEASVMTAILLGDKSDLDSDVKKLYQSNGVVHILSISGLHITVIGLGLYRLLRRMGMSVPAAALCGGAALLLYGIMTGLSVSACRAVGMYLLRMLAFLCRRTYDMLTALGVMAALLALHNPGYTEYMGFLLSFASILGVGALYPALKPTRGLNGSAGKTATGGWRIAVRDLVGRAGKTTTGKWRVALRDLVCRAGKTATGGWRVALRGLVGSASDKLAEGFLAGLSITLTTLPIQLWFTYEVPVWSVLLNVLVLPFMGILVTAGLVAMLAPGFGFVGTVDIWILTGCEKLCGLFERLPFHTWNPGRPQLWRLAVYYALWLAVVWGAARRKEADDPRDGSRAAQRRFTGLWKRLLRHPGVAALCKAAALLLAVLLLGIRGGSRNRVTFLDVGQGDCICVQLSTGETYLFDCGSSSRSGIGEKVLIPFLKYYGISKLDAVFVSHADEDHVSGLRELFALCGEERIAVERIVLAGTAAQAALQPLPGAVSYVSAGDGLWPEEILPERFLCLNPPRDFTAAESNAASECFYMEFAGGFSLLLTGDVEGAGEAALLRELRKQGIRDVTVLKTAHHGSKNSTSEEFLAQISPKLAVISCGRNNRYGHPHAETLERLEKSGARILRTDQSGAVTVWIKKKSVVVEGFIE